MSTNKNRDAIDFDYDDGVIVARFTSSHLEDDVWKEALSFVMSEENRMKLAVISEPFQSYLRFSEFTLKLRELIPLFSNLSIAMTNGAAALYYLLKEILWRNESINIQIEISVNRMDGQNPLINYMGMFVDDLHKFIQISNQEATVVLDLRRLHSLDASDTFAIQNCFMSRDRPLFSKSFATKPSSGTTLGIDVIIPVRGTPIAEVARALTSVTPQLQRGDTVIIVDDNDEESKELQKLVESSSRYRYVRGQAKGVAEARNFGLQASQNDLISFIDSDDFVGADFIESQRSFHIRHRNVAATGTWLQGFGAHETIYPQWDQLQLFGILYCLPPAGVLMWKASVIKEELGGFDTSFHKGFEDFNLVVKAGLKQKPIVVRDQIGYFYQRGHSSLTQQWSAQEIFEMRQRILRNSQQLEGAVFDSFLMAIRRFGFEISDTPIDILSHKWIPHSHIPLMTYLLARYRNSSSTRKKWYKLPSFIRRRLFNLVRFICFIIDRISESERGRFLRRLYRI